ncbi:MAG: phosphoadenylyl-sulfate reductase [Candidatus Hydrogenedentes bacterium]|nr:phosphoadenylyl-sulfate reductase [Candidatus Hydrogenedentota bacterium]
MATVPEPDILEYIEGLSAEEIIKWAYDTHGDRAALQTSLQNTGCVQIDIASRVAPRLRIITVDTWRLPEETYQLIDEIEQRYGITLERFEPDADRVKQMIERHGEYLFFDSKEKQEYCCTLRKVEPNTRSMETVDALIGGRRRDQSNFRKKLPKAEYTQTETHSVLKLNPLADWTENQIWDYIRAHNVPYSKLYEQGYTSIGCKICTTPTKPWEDKRAGRWRWFNQLDPDANKECGIHLGGSGI